MHAPLCLSSFLSGLHTIYVTSCLFDSTVRFGWCFISCGVKDVWAFGLMSPTFHPFLGLGIAWVKALIFLPSLCSFFPVSVGLFAMDPTTPFHHACYSIISLLYFLFPVGLQADALAVPAHFPHLYFFWALLANIFVVLAHFILRVFSAHILLLFLPLLLQWAFC